MADEKAAERYVQIRLTGECLDDVEFIQKAGHFEGVPKPTDVVRQAVRLLRQKVEVAAPNTASA